MTQAEVTWIHEILKYGCICCRKDGYGFVPAEVHHILTQGKKRMGHIYTLPLCDKHHRGTAKGVLSRHGNHKPWIAKYGTELDLHAEVVRRITKGTFNA